MEDLTRRIAAQTLALNPESSRVDLTLIRNIVRELPARSLADLPNSLGEAVTALASLHYFRSLIVLTRLAIRMDLFECASRLAAVARDLTNSPFRVDILLAAAALAANPSVSDDVRQDVKRIGYDLNLTTRQANVLKLSLSPDAVNADTPGAAAYREFRWPGLAKYPIPVVLVDEVDRPAESWLLLSRVVETGCYLRRTLSFSEELIPARVPPDVPVLIWTSRRSPVGRTVRVGKDVAANRTINAVLDALAEFYDLSRLDRLSPVPSMTEKSTSLNGKRSARDALNNVLLERSKVELSRHSFERILQNGSLELLRRVSANELDVAAAYEATIAVAERYILELAGSQGLGSVRVRQLAGHVAKAVISEVVPISDSAP